MVGVRLVLIGVLAVAAGIVAWINVLGHDPAVWHVDPTTAARHATPNDALAAPPDTVDARLSRLSKVHRMTPDELIARFKEFALTAPRTAIVAETPTRHLITVVQRTPVLGFPDYVSARAIEVDGGAALVVWSRSRFGRSDFGANARRVDGWLKAVNRSL